MFVENSYALGQQILTKRPLDLRKKGGQFQTPPQLARFISVRSAKLQSGDQILDPALGSGTLICALVEQLIHQNFHGALYIDGYEIDLELYQVAVETLEQLKEFASSHNLQLHLQIFPCDFVLQNLDHSPKYNFILANPPYFKLNQASHYTQAAKGKLKGHTNIYTLFMALALKLLLPGGIASFIVPRSFCSGAYFSAFREEMITQANPISLHLFESRQDNFDSVLQENVVFTFQRKSECPPKPITLSHSQDLTDLNTSTRQLQPHHFIVKNNHKIFFRLPIHEQDERILEVLDAWGGTLHDMGLAVSTGPIVPFRTKEYLVDKLEEHAVPLLWMHNIRPQQIFSNGKNKPIGFLHTPDSQKHLVPVKNYVLLRRFSAKEEARRLVAAPFLARGFSHEWLGLENHLNFIHRPHGNLLKHEVLGLSALLNTGLLDRYFRIVNGNTQANATELRILPLPPLNIIQSIGKALSTKQDISLDEFVTAALKRRKLLPADFPTIQESRFI